MDALTGKQKRFLRGLGQKLRVTTSVGKAGLSDPLVQGVRRLLGEHELIKVRLSDLPGSARKAEAAELAKAADAELVNVLGRTALLYRPNERLPEDRRVQLP